MTIRPEICVGEIDHPQLAVCLYTRKWMTRREFDLTPPHRSVSHLCGNGIRLTTTPSWFARPAFCQLSRQMRACPERAIGCRETTSVRHPDAVCNHSNTMAGHRGRALWLLRTTGIHLFFGFFCPRLERQRPGAAGRGTSVRNVSPLRTKNTITLRPNQGFFFYDRHRGKIRHQSLRTAE